MTEEQSFATIIMEAVTPEDAPRPKILFVKDQKDMFYCRFEAILQSFNCWNRNKRWYDESAMLAGLSAPHIQELMHYGTFVGENGHPDTDSVQRTLSIDPKCICHRVLGYRVENHNLYGTVETLNDDLWGKQMTKQILQGMIPSFSLRALAPLTKAPDGRVMCKSQPHIVAYDRVILPSHKEAYMNLGKPVSMHESIAESFVPAMSNIYADTSLQVTNESAIAYIKEASLNCKAIKNNFDVSDGSIRLIDNGKKILFRDKDNPGIKYVSDVESYVAREVSSIYKNLRNK